MIYQYILKDKSQAGDLYTHLRLRKKRKKRYGSQNRRGMILNRVSIEKRPALVDQRSRIGDTDQKVQSVMENSITVQENAWE